MATAVIEGGLTWERIVPDQRGMRLTEQEASAVQHWICRRYEQLNGPYRGTRRRTDPPKDDQPVPLEDPRLTLTEWRRVKGWTMTDILIELRRWQHDRNTGRGPGFSLKTIQAIENGTSNWRQCRTISIIEEILGLERGGLKVERSYTPRMKSAAA